MTAGLIVIVAVGLGFAVPRWWVLLLGPLAGLAVLGLSLSTVAGISDTPALFVMVIATAGLALGVLARRPRRLT